jgi:Uma2 family endonuclease
MVAPSVVRTSTDFYPPVTLQLWPAFDITVDKFIELCQQNRDLRLELTAEGELEIMSPAFSETGAKNLDLSMSLGFWAKQDKTGIAFDSSAGFKLPNGAIRAPDASWIRRDRVAQLTDEQKQKFWQICPDFVVELRSSSDTLRKLQKKMKEYIRNGAQLGWLIDPETRQVFIYRPNQPVETLKNPLTLTGDPTLPGFVLDLKEIWEPNF